MKKTVFYYTVVLTLILGAITPARAQQTLTMDGYKSPLTRTYIYPQKVIWQNGDITNAGKLLLVDNGQANLVNEEITTFKNNSGDTTSIVLDFGKQIHGCVEMVTGMWGRTNTPRNIRIRLGESVAEAMSDIAENGATNDHAMRDFHMQLPWLGKNQTGESGFRFVRIDFVDPNAELLLKELRAIAIYRDIPYLGSFKSSDERLNKIWEAGAYTVHLNMQDYLWDGVKRDRLVWVGDLHPEVATINAVFGYNEVVPRSLDLARESTPLPGWMNNISTYSMWWIIIHHDWYMHHGDLEYLAEQGDYLRELVLQIANKVVNGVEKMDGHRFLDWPSSEDSIAIHNGIQAMTLMALEKATYLSEILQDQETLEICRRTVAKMRKHKPALNSSKQAAALSTLSGIVDAKTTYNQVLKQGGAQGFSTFYGYYMLQAMAQAGHYDESLDIISSYWGGMLDLGATTFWEDFDINWLENAGRIDELVPVGKKDVHGDYGDYCYRGYRHSLCHGWASGPTAWLSEHVLGIKIVEPGCKTVKIEPNLGQLSFVEGTYPTPYGLIQVKHIRNGKGKIETEITAPEQVKIIR